MKKVVLIPVLFLITTLLARAQDSTSHIKYFDEDFDVREVQAASYFGIISRSGKQYLATLFTPKNSKIATLSFWGKDLSKKDGPLIGYTSTGDTQFVSRYAKNSLDGPWQSWYPNGQPCDSGRMKNNAPDGLWKSWYPDGTLRFIAQFDSKRLSSVKEEMRRIFRPSFRSAYLMRAEVRMGNSGLLFQQYLYQQMQEAIHPKDILGNHPGMGLKLKVDKNTSLNSDIYSPPFSECVVHGMYKSYFPDGSLKDSGYCHNGSRYGVWEEWTNDNTVRSIGFYKNGIKRGEWRYYDKEGKFLYLKRFNRSGKEKELIDARRK
jgi:antitoxin component YwqK of YwqJK toxin-antitoxin module